MSQTSVDIASMLDHCAFSMDSNNDNLERLCLNLPDFNQAYPSYPINSLLSPINLTHMFSPVSCITYFDQVFCIKLLANLTIDIGKS